MTFIEELRQNIKTEQDIEKLRELARTAIDSWQAADACLRDALNCVLKGKAR